MPVNKTRIRPFNSHTYAGGPVLYWMGRDHRVQDNWGLLAAQAIAEKQGVPLVVVFTLVPTYLGATRRQYGFMLRGFEAVERELTELNIPFYLPTGDPEELILKLVKEWEIGCIVTDFLPLRIIRYWKERVAAKVTIPMYEVDSHNVVPAWIASPKQEFGAYTLRPKLHKLWDTYLEEFPVLHKQKTVWAYPYQPVDWPAARASVQVDEAVTEITWCTAGSNSANTALQDFIRERLTGYAEHRNVPGEYALSEMSPYYHYGHVAPQRAALEVMRSSAPEADKEAYIEELLVRRELSDNFCMYCSTYDSLDGAPKWARESLAKHSADPRPVMYSREVLEAAQTGDDLWNAAQKEMVRRGKMHGYMRMYWAKKILEWSPTPEEAVATAIYLNDKYFVDGRDPNGYVGILWAMGGLHDRAWFEREIFGQIRYMNYNGAKRKFNIQAYIGYVEALRS